MGAKTWMLAYVEGDAPDILKSSPELDRDAADDLARRLFPNDKLDTSMDGSLDFTCPPENEVYVGCFPGVSIIAASEFGVDYPSRLPADYLDAADGRKVYLHAMHSVVDWFAYAIWEKRRLVRSLSLSPDSGILEDQGVPRPFEEPYWGGHHALDESYPLPFHPLELGEAALLDLFGYQLEGEIQDVEPWEIPLVGFKR